MPCRHDLESLLGADEERDQLAEVMIRVFEEPGKHLHHAGIEAPLVRRQLVPVLYVRIVPRQLYVCRQVCSFVPRPCLGTDPQSAGKNGSHRQDLSRSLSNSAGKLPILRGNRETMVSRDLCAFILGACLLTFLLLL